jgi:hypothetical protein
MRQKKENKESGEKLGRKTDDKNIFVKHINIFLCMDVEKNGEYY